MSKKAELKRTHVVPKPEPLSDQRYKDLLACAGEFFAAAEPDLVAEKQAAIDEILAKMSLYGITIDDLQKA